MALVAVYEVSDVNLERSIRFISERPLLIGVTFPQDLVPERMELVDFIVVGKWEGVGTLVASDVLLVESVFAVERLVNVADIVDEKTESE